MGYDYYNFVYYFTSSGLFYELMPYIFEKYGNREMILKLYPLTASFTKFSTANEYNFGFSYNLLSLINMYPYFTRNVDFTPLLQEQAEIKGSMQFNLE